MLLRPFAAGALAALALTAPAAADTTRAKRVKLAGQPVSCYVLLPIAGKGIECTSPGLEEIGELDTYVALTAHGRSRIGERGDYPGYGGRRVRLDPGDVWRVAGIACTARRARLVCRNASGHGFRLGADAVARF